VRTHSQEDAAQLRVFPSGGTKITSFSHSIPNRLRSDQMGGECSTNGGEEELV
jgi:hypothetical protein